MFRKAEAPLQSCVQKLKAWEKKHFIVNPRLRTVVSLLCAMLFAYRLLQLSRWSHTPMPNRHAVLRPAQAMVVQQATWLPNPWVGRPEELDPLACTPQLLIIGVMKGGTTALFHYLNGSEPAIHYSNGTKSHVDYRPRFHPSIIGSHVTKELHFFDKQFRHVNSTVQQRAYFSRFAGVDITVDSPMKRQCSYPAKLGLTSVSKPALIRMEATAMYLAHPHAAQNVHMLLPQARLVALLREPVSRALSSVNMLFQRSPMFSGLKELSPEYNKAWQHYVTSELQNQLHTIEDCNRKVTPHLSYYKQMDHCAFDATGMLKDVLHIYVGMYAVHLERWFSNFPPQQLLIWSSHAFDARPRQHMEQLVEWLGLDSTLNQPESNSFEKLHERSYPAASLPKSIFDWLQGFFEPHNQRLFDLLEAKGYKGLVQQLKIAWHIELQDTIGALQQPQQQQQRQEQQ